MNRARLDNRELETSFNKPFTSKFEQRAENFRNKYNKQEANLKTLKLNTTKNPHQSLQAIIQSKYIPKSTNRSIRELAELFTRRQENKNNNRDISSVLEISKLKTESQIQYPKSKSLFRVNIPFASNRQNSRAIQKKTIKTSRMKKVFRRLNVQNIQLIQAEQSQVYLLKQPGNVMKIPTIKYLWIEASYDSPNHKDNYEQLMQSFNIAPLKTIKQAKNMMIKNTEYRIITSGNYAEQVCKEFKQQRNVSQIYIFCAYLPVGKALMNNNFQKIKFYTDNIQECLVKLRRCSVHSSTKVISNFVRISSQRTDINLNLMYNIYGLFLLKNKLKAKNDFLKLSRFLYKDQMLIIDDFQKNYSEQTTPTQMIIWYTKQCFFFRLVNALLDNAASNLLELGYIRFPIYTLFVAIKTHYNTYRKTANFRAYRGGQLKPQQIQYLMKHKGEYIEFLSFQSATKKKSLAESFAKNVFIVFEIEHEQRDDQTDYGYINLKDINVIKGQDEIIFNILNIFKIDDVKEDYMIEQPNKIKKKVILINLKYGKLSRIIKKNLNFLNEIEKAPELQQSQKEVLKNYENRKFLIQKFETQGDVLIINRQFQQSIQFYKNLSEYYETKYEFKEYQIKLYKIYNRIALSYKQIAQKELSLAYYLKTFQILQKCDQKNTTFASVVTNNIGLIYLEMENYDQSLRYFKKCLKIQEQTQGYPANTYNNIGQCYYKKHQYKKAIQFFHYCLQLQSLSEEIRPLYICVLGNLGQSYEAVEDIGNSLKYNLQCLKAQQKYYGDTHEEIEITYNNLGMLYLSQKQYDKAKEYFEQSYKTNVKLYGEDHIKTKSALKNLKKAKATTIVPQQQSQDD